ncbi:MAG TPA: hypothetical protein VH092_33755, partial [Urbifossiella sp.]|nr:hypothetical protein [Urbifossiella sp.]
PAPTSPVRVAVRPQPAAAKQAGPGTLLLAREGSLVTLTPNGKEGTEVMTVNALTKKELVTTDEKGRKDTLLRVEEKK